MKKIIWGMLFLSLSFLSCEQENLTLKPSSNKYRVAGEDFSLVNGRLKFESKEAFSDFYQKYADSDEDTLAEILKPLYVDGFLSLRPAVTEENEELLLDNYEKKFQAVQMEVISLKYLTVLRH